MAITYPVPASTFPSAEWWANLAASTQASIDAAQNAAVTTAAANTSSAVASAQAALQAAIDGKAPTVHTHTRAQISDATTLGRDLLGAASPAVARESIGAFAWHDYIGTGSLDAVVEHGIYRQHSGEWAKVANGYPADNVPGMLEVFRVTSSTARVQRYTSDRPEGGMWTRRGSFDGSVWSWSAWVAYAPTRVDTTVGTRVFVGGQMVYGDTGWRAVTTWDADGNYTGIPLDLSRGLAPQPGRSGGVYWRRVGPIVYCRMVGIRAEVTDPRLPIPSSLSPGGAPWATGLFMAGTNGVGSYRTGSAFVFLSVPSAPLSLPSPGSEYGAELSWLTVSAWPASLPGTPA